ncbi:unnamed protein product [Rotaria socialis]|nr:unnamed protein product [Rotaria socialis]
MLSTVTILAQQAELPFEFSSAVRPPDNPRRMWNIPREVVNLPPDNGIFQGVPPQDADWPIEADTSDLDQLVWIDH